MSREKRFVIQVDPLEMEDDAIFDNKELRLYECQSDMMSDICSLLNKQDQRIAELEERLKNAIVPKFKVGQEVWWIDTIMNSFNEQRYRIESYLIDSIVITNKQFRYYGDDGLWLGDNELFATKEEAEAKLKELGENK